jgi:hypothetical protein
MAFVDILRKYQSVILERWVQLVLDTYPSDSTLLLDREKDRFLNPVGYTLREEAEVLLKGLLDRAETSKLSVSLDRILRIRSIQNFAPSQAVGFIPLLKKAIAEILEKRAEAKPGLEEWLKFQDRIDALLFHAFDLYMGCKEQVYELRVKQEKVQREMLVRVLQHTSLPDKNDENEEDIKS